ncbi:MAG: anthranilate synthase component I family protein [Candidatus Marinimicrobia bacterium]|nr:anthranilate synthase component I family protein [Candidatus Neomarinimicrobiota bacterium]
MNANILNNSSLRPALFWSKSKKGWKRIIASNPIDILEGDKTLPVEIIQQYFKKYTGKLILGFISYEYGVAQHDVITSNPSLFNIPDVYFAAYDKYEEIDKIPLSNDLVDPRLAFQSTTSKQQYLDAIGNIINHIRQGNIYQANFTHFLKSEYEGESYQLFKQMIRQNPVEFSSFLHTPDFTIHSLSPERFATIRGNSIFTEPIKGTRPRGENQAADNQNREALLSSEKEKAELNMITDLLRNDLGKISEIGSVNVTKNREVMPLEAVWHTHSIIEGHLKENVSPIEAILSMIPGGSITGCPKKRAVEIIDDLETYKRGLYTGTIGIQYPNGDSDWSIAIRTLIEQNNNLYLGIGGGITLDSIPEDEYAESLAKAKSFMEIRT